MSEETYNSLVKWLRQPPVCAHCNQSVDLTAAVTDEHGRAMHQACYVEALKPRIKQAQTAKALTRT